MRESNGERAPARARQTDNTRERARTHTHTHNTHTHVSTHTHNACMRAILTHFLMLQTQEKSHDSGSEIYDALSCTSKASDSGLNKRIETLIEASRYCPFLQCSLRAGVPAPPRLGRESDRLCCGQHKGVVAPYFSQFVVFSS